MLSSVFIGVDGHSGGWIAVAIGHEGFMAARSFLDFRTLLAAHEHAKVIAVDIPIGLVDAPTRAADQAARVVLRGSASSVFNAPPRRALAAASYAEAAAITLEVCKKGLSRQSYALFAKIREVDAYEHEQRLFEVHPEVSFRLMAPGRPLLRKKSWGGLNARLTLLADQGIVVPRSLGEADDVGIDDVVDAAAAAWSARRIGNGVARRLPEDGNQKSASGRLIGIWG